MKKNKYFQLLIIPIFVTLFTFFSACKKTETDTTTQTQSVITPTPTDTTPPDFRSNYIGSYICSQIIQETFIPPLGSSSPSTTTYTTVSTTDTVIVTLEQDSSLHIVSPTLNRVYIYATSDRFNGNTSNGEYAVFTSPDSIYVSRIIGMFKFERYYGKKM